MTKRQLGFSAVELILVALVVCLLLAIIFKNFQESVLMERRSLAQQALVTVTGLQERWFVRMYEYAVSIDEVGGEDSAGDHYRLRITQDPCGDRSCFTVTAVAIGEQEADVDCEKMSITNTGVRRAVNRRNEDTSATCWEDT